MSKMIKQGTVMRNDFNGEAFVFSGDPDDPDRAKFEGILQAGGSNGGGGLVHVHPCADEYFTVKFGRLQVMIGDKSLVLEAGETAMVARGQPHSFVNVADGVTEFTTEFRPPQHHFRFFANFGFTVQNRKSWFSKNGKPNFLLMALILNTYRNHLYLAGVPIALQKAIFAICAPLAYLRGYRVEIGPLDPV